MKDLIADLMERLDVPFNDEEVFEKVKPQDQNPLKIVLLQEVSRYNKLLAVIRKNLINLDLAISGQVPISE